MIRAFNAFQLVSLFAALPFIVGWLKTNPFPLAVAAFWVAIVAYLVLFIVLCIAAFELTDK